MALADNSLTTLDKLNIPLAESNPDEAEFLIAVASQVIENELNRGLQKKERQEEYAGHTGRRLYLNSWPVDSVADVKIDDRIIDDYVLKEKRGFLERSAGWSDEETFIEVTYTGGYILPGNDDRDLPVPLEMACILFVKFLYNNKLDDLRVQRETRGGLSKTFFADDDLPRIPKTVTLLINNYKRQLV